MYCKSFGVSHEGCSKPVKPVTSVQCASRLTPLQSTVRCWMPHEANRNESAPTVLSGDYNPARILRLEKAESKCARKLRG